MFLEREGKVGNCWGRPAAELEAMDYLELFARVTSHIPDKAQGSLDRLHELMAHAAN